ncbi:Diguanylate cyclase/phosphodiesterase domain 1 (GGDEF) [Paramagnetospirillum magnetotacticum MS-1]|uniref:Diguanylate cyclase/phosphodiesterase domain 1 (GGDEF) n=1 Tax=Paramagnetospirillum magnetotacticum MS-1 TaxID=272627 RepID=A0A0C2YY98_PARME|nr:cache domain-containing protein [Paramagnetospirillum magnetotacticum]KIM00064.1 Diguanylate cyclase/phosphodiesterase domain 1 (GGDEF) [Paramagnetospirillum magnetotacticum MS-1]
MVKRVHRTLKAWVKRWLPLLLAPPALLALLFNTWEFAGLWIEHDKAFEEAQVQVQSLSREVSRTLVATLGPVDIHITDHLRPAATRLLASPASRPQLQRVFQLTAQRLPQVAAVVVFDASGRAVAASVPTLRPFSDISGGHFFQRHRDQGLESAIFVGDSSLTVAETGPARWRLMISQRLRDLDGRFVGMLLVQLDTEQIFSRIADLNLIAGAGVRIFDDSGRLLVNHPRDYSLAGRNFLDTRLFRRWAAEKRELAGRIPDPTDDSPEIGVFRTIEGYPILISVGLPEDAALLEWWRELAILMLTVVAFVAASSLAARRPLAKWVLHLNGKGEDDKGFADGDGI